MNKDGKKPKIFLYSAHDITVISLLSTLNVYKMHLPKYSSSVILEKWEKDSESYIKVCIEINRF
jgi:hypothetical protein